MKRFFWCLLVVVFAQVHQVRLALRNPAKDRKAQRVRRAHKDRKDRKDRRDQQERQERQDYKEHQEEMVQTTNPPENGQIKCFDFVL